MDDIDDIRIISNILESCAMYDSPQFMNMARSIRIDNNQENGKTSKFSIAFNNIDGNASNFDSFLSEISQYNHQFSIIAIAETNIDEENGDLYKICNYSSEYNSKFPNKKKGSGLGMYIHENFQCNRIEKLCQCSPNLESLFVQVTNTAEPLTVGVVYRPPNGNIKQFYLEIDSLLKSLPNKNVYITGDFNINLLAKNSEFEQTLYGNNFIPTISIPTHEKPGCNASLIDNILFNSTNNFLKSGVLESSVSHHHPVFGFFVCNAKKPESDTSMLPKYDFCETNTESFLIEIKNEISDRDFEYSEVDFESFNSILNEKIDNNFKVDNTIFGKSKRNRLLNPWITNGIVVSVRKKSYYYKRWKKTCTKHNLHGDITLYLMYKDFRKELRKIIKLAKKNYYCKKFENFKGNIKKTWQLINELRGKSKTDIKASFIIDEQIVTGRREISNGFNIFFSSIAHKMNAKVRSSTLASGNQHQLNYDYKKYLATEKQACNSMFLSNCDEQEVLEIIHGLENGKASDISIPILKKCSIFLSRHLVGFFNSFMEKGLFPNILKKGMITPIFKKGDSRYLDNYRPVSTLPIFGKIFEKLIHNRLYSFFMSMNTIFNNQFGFRKKHSTSHAVNYSVNKILSEIEKKNHVIGIFIDLSKAFDTLPHGQLLAKLYHYGIRGKSYSILENYLTGRTQQTKFQGTNSDVAHIEYGVPQGSVLGPLLFLIYINDIVNSTNLGSFVLFADDTNIFVVGRTAEEAYKQANIVLEKVYRFMLSNKLHINSSKSCYMYFRPRHDNAERQTCARARPFGSELILKLCGKKLKKVDKVKFLGVIIDDKLNWEDQIDHIEVKLNCSIVMIKRIKRFIPKSEYMKIYNALFMSHLTYCISCWGGIPVSKLQKIFAIQKRCVRLLFGKDFSFDHPEFYETCARCRTFEENMAPKNYCLEHTKPLFNEHNILSLNNLYAFHTFMELFKIVKFCTPISLYDLFEVSSRSQLIILPRVNLDVSKQNFVFQSALIWNKFSGVVFEKCIPQVNGIVIPGSAYNSDLAASTSTIKNKLKLYLLASQKLGNETEWA